MNNYFIANWKQNGLSAQVDDWINAVTQEHELLSQNKIIVCPSFTALSQMARRITDKNAKIALGAQNISRFEDEKHTGEISATLVAEFAHYAIIGHSERRKDFGETDDIVGDKIKIAMKNNLTGIVCVSDMEQITMLKNIVGTFNGIIAYEPISAVGTGTADNPENAKRMAHEIKTIFPEASIIYGGSVDSMNVRSFIEPKVIDGVLVGNRSIDSSFFLEIIKNAH